TARKSPSEASRSQASASSALSLISRTSPASSSLKPVVSRTRFESTIWPILTSSTATCACPPDLSSQNPGFPGEQSRSSARMHAYRTHNCGQLRAGDVGKQARISGWVHRKRDHGGLLFIDLRDHYGLTQCVVTPSNPNFGRLEKLRVETVVTLTGEVLARETSTVNPNLPTGAIELKVADIAVQSEAEELPLPVF